MTAELPPQDDFLQTGVEVCNAENWPPEGASCSICASEYIQGVAALDHEIVERIIVCGHYFHADCIHTWFSSTQSKRSACPNCRRELFIPNPLTAEQVESLFENQIEPDDERRPMLSVIYDETFDRLLEANRELKNRIDDYVAAEMFVRQVRIDIDSKVTEAKTGDKLAEDVAQNAERRLHRGEQWAQWKKEAVQEAATAVSEFANGPLILARMLGMPLTPILPSIEEDDHEVWLSIREHFSRFLSSIGMRISTRWRQNMPLPLPLLMTQGNVAVVADWRIPSTRTTSNNPADIRQLALVDYNTGEETRGPVLNPDEELILPRCTFRLLRAFTQIPETLVAGDVERETSIPT